jgi:hypothetical protein
MYFWSEIKWTKRNFKSFKGPAHRENIKKLSRLGLGENNPALNYR